LTHLAAHHVNQPTSQPTNKPFSESAILSLNHRPLIGIPAGSLEPSPAADAPYFQFNGNYTAALAAADAIPVVIPPNLPEGALVGLFERLDGLCLAGGADVDPTHYGEPPHPALKKVDPPRDHLELILARWALAADLPILGICRGIQLLNVAAGGALYQDIAAQLPAAGKHAFKLSESPWERPTHGVRLAEGSALARIVGQRDLLTNSFHHQAVSRLAAGFVATGWAADGVVEAIEDPTRRFVVGVQWHPEAMVASNPLARRLFAAFVEACARRGVTRGEDAKMRWQG